jgi:DNA-binding CsgD family transcriptional regulator
MNLDLEVNAMVFELEIAIQADKHWWGVITSKLALPITILDMSVDMAGRVQNLVEIEIGNVSTIKVLNSLIGLEDLESFNVSEVIGGKVIVILGEKVDSISSNIILSGCFFRSIKKEGNKIIWNLIAPQKSNAQELANLLEANTTTFDLVRLVPLSKDDGIMTPRQEQILKVAYDGGYFDKPKGIGVREIAQELGISTATVSETLRRAIKQLLENKMV